MAQAVSGPFLPGTASLVEELDSIFMSLFIFDVL